MQRQEPLWVSTTNYFCERSKLLQIVTAIFCFSKLPPHKPSKAKQNSFEIFIQTSGAFITPNAHHHWRAGFTDFVKESSTPNYVKTKAARPCESTVNGDVMQGHCLFYCRLL